MALGTTANLAGVSPIPFKAGGTITAAGTLVKLDSTEGQVVAAAAITDACIGVALNSASSGDQVQVQMYGVADCVSNGTVTLGAEVMFATGAKVTDSSGATARSVGIALQAASADGDHVKVLLCCPTLKGPANS